MRPKPLRMVGEYEGGINPFAIISLRRCAQNLEQSRLGVGGTEFGGGATHMIRDRFSEAIPRSIVTTYELSELGLSPDHQGSWYDCSPE